MGGFSVISPTYKMYMLYAKYNALSILEIILAPVTVHVIFIVSHQSNLIEYLGDYRHYDGLS